MNTLPRLGCAAVLTALLWVPAAEAALQSTTPLHEPAPAVTLARGGGGSRGGGSSRGSVGGGSRSGGLSRPSTTPRSPSGFQNAGSSLSRGDRSPSGGWSRNTAPAQARPSLSRPSSTSGLSETGSREVGNRDVGNRAVERPSLSPGLRDGGLQNQRDGLGTVNRDGSRSAAVGINRNWTRTVNINTINVHPGWARPGWGVARPWNTGWYGSWNSPTWGWWGARAAAWGIGTLATAAVINSAVDAAIDNQTTSIVVPNTSYQLLYGSVAPTGTASISFAIVADGSTYPLTADCQAGTLNGALPASAAEAELLNAACQVAFGST